MLFGEKTFLNKSCSKYCFRLFRSYAEISNQKNQLRWSKFSGIYANLNSWSKVSKYSIKSEAVTRRCTIKKQFWRVLNISQKKYLAWASWNKVAGLQPETSFRKRHLYRCFPRKYAKYSKAPFFAKHVLVTASVKYLFARQPQSPNVTIELVFCLLPTTIVRANISFFWMF